MAAQYVAGLSGTVHTGKEGINTNREFLNRKPIYKVPREA